MGVGFQASTLCSGIVLMTAYFLVEKHIDFPVGGFDPLLLLAAYNYVICFEVVSSKVKKGECSTTPSTVQFNKVKKLRKYR